MWVGLLLAGRPLQAVVPQRFPRPDFQSGYLPPVLSVPPPRAVLLSYLDAGVLALVLALAAWLALRRRSRRGLLGITVFSLAYFGFWRRGCVCAVGSVQNVALTLADVTYTIPLTVLVFFALPLLAALFFGRVFCAGVCPLGAAQELVVWRPVKLPLWLNHVLSLIPWGYLGVALLFAATGTGFPICRWDPFVGFFRLGAPFHMLVFGLLVLAVGLFVGRPYCRFLCPYGALLGVLSCIARRHVTITPGSCVQCRLCETACPYDAIRKPMPPTAPEPRRKGVRRLVLLLSLTPPVILASGAAGYLLGPHLAHANDRVALVRALSGSADGPSADMRLERDAFLTSGEPADRLIAEARRIQRRFALGGAVLGAMLAFVAACKLFGLSVRRSRVDYEPDRAWCMSCARCFAYCPVPPA